jgi:hypothetical protein
VDAASRLVPRLTPYPAQGEPIQLPSVERLNRFREENPMFDLFVLRDAAQRRVTRQFETQTKGRATVTAAVEEGRLAVRRTASALALRLRLVSDR